MVKRAMLGGLIGMLILGSWIGNILYYQQLQLKEPMILKQKMTLYSDRHEMIALNYIENKHAGKKITGIQLVDYPHVAFHLNEAQSYSHQVMMRATAEFQFHEDELQGKLPFVIKDALVYYNEGPPAKVPIGEIRIEKEQPWHIFGNSSSSMSSDGLGSYTTRATENVELFQIGLAEIERMKPWLMLNLSDESVFEMKLPITYDKNDAITFTYQWSIPDHERAAYELFQTNIQLHFRTQDGRVFVENVPITKSFQLSSAQVRHLVRSGGVPG